MWPPGLRPNKKDSKGTSLPVNVAFHPMWKDPASQQPLLATTLGLPLADVFAYTQTVVQPGLVPPQPTTSDASTPFVFTGLLPQPYSVGDPSDFYLMEMVPQEPFDVFPPTVTSVSVPLVGLGTVPSPFAPVTYNNPVVPSSPVRQRPQNGTYHVQALAGAPDLTGWKVYIVDGDRRRISSVHLLAGQTDDFVLYDATGRVDQTNETLFIDPPVVDYPRLDTPALGSPGLIPFSFIYPALPPAVTVEGFVYRPDMITPTVASITFVADGSSTGAVFGTDGTTPINQLLYTKTISTTAGGQWAAMSVPPGLYRAYVIPQDPTLALTVQPQTFNLVSPQLGHGLHANARTHVKGRVVLGDGTPIYNATVVIDSSADAPFAIPKDDVLMRPRETQGHTDVNGYFDVLSDSGAVDISVRPQDGTRFPWAVLTNRIVPPSSGSDAGTAGTLTLPNVVIPLPTPYPTSGAPGLLTDSTGVPLPHAVVRAYAFPTLTAPPDGGTPASRGARLIGLTITDDTGAFQLFTAPPDP
jgi:hypothetical protein